MTCLLKECGPKMTCQRLVLQQGKELAFPNQQLASLSKPAENDYSLHTSLTIKSKRSNHWKRKSNMFIHRAALHWRIVI